MEQCENLIKIGSAVVEMVIDIVGHCELYSDRASTEMLVPIARRRLSFDTVILSYL